MGYWLNKDPIPQSPCPPDQFSGRSEEREQILEILKKTYRQGQVVMISGARGSGKTSFLDWTEYKIQNEQNGIQNPVIKKSFFETPGMIFVIYKEILIELQKHKKFGWFKKILENSNIKKSIELVLNILEKADSLVILPDSLGISISSFASVFSKLLQSRENIEYSYLLNSILEVFSNLSQELQKNNRFITILLDDVQWASKNDFVLLKDLIKSLPPSIVLIFTFRIKIDNEIMEKHRELRTEISRYSYVEFLLGGMQLKEIQDFAKCRYSILIDDSIASLLSHRIGDPLCLINCFNLLQRRDLEPIEENILKIIPEAVNPANTVYSELDNKWKERVNALCILHPPLKLPLIACMLSITDRNSIINLREELDQSVIFKRIEKETYDYSHPSLREYLKEEMPEDSIIYYHSRAAECFKSLRNKFPDNFPFELFLTDHLFFSQKYEEALELNLQVADRLKNFLNFDLSLEFTLRAKICSEKSNNNLMLACVQNKLGYLFVATERLEEAEKRFKEALNLYKTLSREEPKNVSCLSGISDSLNALGNLFSINNEKEKAQKSYEDAFHACEISLELEPDNFHCKLNKATTMSNLGDLFACLEKFEESKVNYENSGNIYKSLQEAYPNTVEYRLNVSIVLNKIGDLLQKEGKFPEAITYYSEALYVVADLNSYNLISLFYYSIGKCYENMGDLDCASKHYLKSICLVEQINGEFLLDDTGSVIWDKNELYLNFISLLCTQGKIEAAWNCLERLNSYNLLDYLHILEPSKLSNLSSISTDIDDNLQLVLKKNWESKTKDAYNSLSVSQEILESKGKSKDLYDRIAAFVPENVYLRTGKRLEIEEIKNVYRKQKKKITFIEYYTTPDKLFIFLLRFDDTQPKVTVMNLSSNSLKDYIKRFYLEIEQPSMTQTWQGLAEYLIAPVFEDLYGSEILCIVPHGDLCLFPFHALSIKRKYLIEYFPIVYEPNLSVIKYVQESNSEKSGFCLSIGFSPHEESTAYELESILVSDILGTTPHLGEDASIQLLTNMKYDIIHLSCPVSFSDQNPLESGLTLADGVLKIRDLFNMNIKTNLAFLSGGGTELTAGLSEQKSENTMVSFSRALLYNGTQSVITTLWSVDSDSTPYFIKEFYTKINEKNMNKAEALQKIQIEFINNQKYSYPYYWAPFVLIGEWK